MNDINPVDLAVIIVYFAGVAYAGIYFARRNNSTEEYFLGNRSFPGWAIGLSMVGTSISSISFLAYPGDAFKTAWLRMVPNFTLPIGVLVAVYFFLPFFRRSRVTSAFEYLESRYGPSTRVYGAAAFLLGQVFRLGTILFLVSLLVHEFTGWNLQLCVVVGGIFVSFYTVVGGIEAVVWTDVVQTIILVGGGIACMIVIIWKMPGGLTEIITTASEAGKFAFAEFNDESKTFEPASWKPTLFEKTAFMMLVIGLTNWLTEYSCNQTVVQRYCASKSLKEARKAMWICCFSSVPIWAFFMFLGTSLWVFFQTFPADEATAMLNGEVNAEQILPFFAIKFLPWGLGGLVLAAALAAAMSSLDSSINAVSTVTVVDIYRRHLVKDRDDKHYLMAARIIAVVSSIVMIIGALIFSYVDPSKLMTLQHTGTIIGALTGGGLMGLYFLGFFTTRGDSRAVGVAIVCTLIFSAYRALASFDFIPEALQLGLLDRVDEYYTGILGHVLMFLVGLVFGTIFTRPKGDLKNLTVWTQDGQPIE